MLALAQAQDLDAVVGDADLAHSRLGRDAPAKDLQQRVRPVLDDHLRRHRDTPTIREGPDGSVHIGC
jgi:hypothetical protein